MSEYLVIIEGGPGAYGAYVPDLPGCVSVGATLKEVRRLIREAIPFHLEGLRDAGEPVPSPSSVLVDFVAAPAM
jgi:predicted RNase H-like HicB family nuclease